MKKESAPSDTLTLSERAVHSRKAASPSTSCVVYSNMAPGISLEEDYQDYVEDTAHVITGLQTVVSGSLAEEIAEDLEEIAEDTIEGA